MLKNFSSNPPNYFKSYSSNINRAPKRKHFKIYNSNTYNSDYKNLIKNFKINNNLLLYRKNKNPIGQKIIISGRVMNTYGIALKNVIIEIWQANSSGKYRDENDCHKASLDPNFYGYGCTKTNKSGMYKFISILPEHILGKIIRTLGGPNIFIFLYLTQIYFQDYAHKCTFQEIFCLIMILFLNQFH